MQTHQRTDRIALQAPTRQAIAEHLSHLVADGIDLGRAARHAHWNVRGPFFAELHRLFEDVTEQVNAQVDDLAERVTTLGFMADGTLGGAMARSRVTPYPTALRDGQGHLKALGDRVGEYAGHLRAALDTPAVSGDPATEDLLGGHLRAAEKLIWRLEAHLA